MSMALLPAVPASLAVSSSSIPFKTILSLVAITATLIAGLHVSITMEFFSLTAIAISSALSTIGIIITGITIMAVGLLEEFTSKLVISSDSEEGGVIS